MVKKSLNLKPVIQLVLIVKVVTSRTVNFMEMFMITNYEILDIHNDLMKKE